MASEPSNNGQVPGDETSVGATDGPTSLAPHEAAIYVEGLTKAFGSGESAVTAVDDVSLAVAPGEVVGLLGPNGAGKTTAIKSILGLVLPEEGTVRVHGIDVHANPRAAYEYVDAMLEGARNDYWRLTVRENLRYFAAIRGQNPDAVAGRHDELLEHLDLAEKADTEVRDLSRGMKQKVSLASVLAGDISVAFLDEPTLGLDIESSLKLRKELRRLVEERGLTLILSSHDMDVIEDVCDRVVIMNEGRVVVDDTVEDLLAGFEARGYRLTARGVDDEALTDLHEQFDLTDVQRTGDRLRFEVEADTETFYRLTDAMEAHSLEVASVETIQADLAEAFVEMTEGSPGAGRASEEEPSTTQKSPASDPPAGDGGERR